MTPIDAADLDARAMARACAVHAAWPGLVAALALLARLTTAPAADAAHPLPDWAGLAAALVAVLALAALAGLSALLAFDAVLFRLIAAYADPLEGGSAVDDVLARTGLKPRPSAIRPLGNRWAGTRRLMRFQRTALVVLLLALFGGTGMRIVP